MLETNNTSVENRRYLVIWRLSHNYSQEELGKVLGVTETCVKRWEDGTRNPNWDMLLLSLKGLSFSHGPHCACPLPNCGRQANRDHTNGRVYDPKIPLSMRAYMQ